MRDILKKILLIFIIALSPVQVFAKNLSSDLTELSLEDLMNVPISTASKYEQKTTETPSSVTIITADEIKKYGYRTLAEILQSVRGFYTSYDRNYAYLGLRGFAKPGDYSTRFLFLVDGHRLNDNIYDFTGIGTDFILDVGLIDRIEIARGPSFSLYGNNAFFGTINVITKTGKSVDGAEVSGSAGTGDTFNGRLTFGKKFANGADLILSASKSASDGNRHLYYKEFDDPSTNNGIAEGVDGDNNYSLFAKASLNDFSFEGGYVSRTKKIPTASWGTAFNDPHTQTTDERTFADLKYVYNFDNDLRTTAHFYYDRYITMENYAYDYPPVTINRDNITGEWIGGEIDFLKRFQERHTVIAGFEYTDNIKQQQLNYDAEPYVEYLNDRRSSTAWAVFAQDEFKVLDNLILNFGVRHDHFSTFGGTTNPRVALIYSPVEPTSLKLLYGSAFRAPNAYELYYNDGSLSSKGALNLNPEKVDDYEIILEQALGKNFTANVVCFYYNTKDLISQIIDPVDGLLVFRNTNEESIKGLELELEGHWESGLKGRFSYSYTRGRDETSGTYLTNSPVNMAKFNLIVPLIKEKFFLGLDEQYMDSRKTLKGNETGSFTKTNLTLLHRNLLDGMEISGGVYNLFNKKYGNPGSGEHVQDIIEQDGRTFKLKVTWSF
jgi:outer membrane receptor for ferrienterochelin and colicins